MVLWAFAVAQPLYSVLRENREFFVAHRATAADLLVFVALLTFLLPAVLYLLSAAVAAAST